jgi:hypothetical protein
LTDEIHTPANQQRRNRNLSLIFFYLYHDAAGQMGLVLTLVVLEEDQMQEDVLIEKTTKTLMVMVPVMMKILLLPTMLVLGTGMGIGIPMAMLTRMWLC